jgi:hypothetical protein
VAYVECPECGFTANTSRGFVSDSCPRCLARSGRRIWLESKDISPPGPGRFHRARKLGETELREAGFGTEPAPAEE